MRIAPAILILLLTAARAIPQDIPDPPREFRGVWVATVANIDWPSAPGLSTDEQKKELLAILNRAVALNLNAIVLQVRPECDALYASQYEPWSEWLTGRMGRAPNPAYDPLQFAVEEAHKRGLELHAWFNPFRANHPKSKSPIAANHVSKMHPEWVRQYGKYLWLDPGEPEVQNYVLRVILDVVYRYDIDAVHLDDYFYPYPERDGDFPDDASWRRYRAGGGRLDRADWRRDNVDNFIRRLYQSVRQAKPWVKVGVSPSGIWRSGFPPSIEGTGSYDALFADTRKWFASGWVDYLAPQLYWRIRERGQSYPVLLAWWAQQNAQGRHLWPGNFTSKVGDASSSAWPAGELINQIKLTREQRGATGNIHFSAKALMENRDGIADLLQSSLYAEQALVPASPWLDHQPPNPPLLAARDDHAKRRAIVTWRPTNYEPVWLWVVRTRSADRWATYILSGRQVGCSVGDSANASVVAVSAVDRCGNMSAPATVDLHNR